MNRRRTIVNAGLGLGVAAVAFSSWAVVDHSTAAKAASSTVLTAQTGTVLSSVSGTGNVIAPTSLSVDFDSALASNKVTQILANTGDKVTAGQPLAKVDDTTTSQALAVAQTQLMAAQAALDKASDPATPDVIAQDQASATSGSVSVQNAKASVSTAQNTLDQDTDLQAAAVAQAAQAQTAAQAKATQDLANEQGTVDQAQATRDADTAKVGATQATSAAAQAQVAKLTNDRALCAANATSPTFVPPDGTPCAQVAGLLTSAGQAATTAQAAVDSAQASITKDTQSLTSAKGAQASLVLSTNESVAQAANAVTNAQNAQTSKLAADQNAIDAANRQVASAIAAYQATLAANSTKEKTPTAADLASQQASLLNAQDALATAQKNEANTTLTAPAAGTIAASTAQVGVAAGGASSSSGSSSSGTTSSSSGSFTLTDLSAMQVKVGFSESDATSINLGQAATITLASITGSSLTGKVTQLDLTSTTVSNVVTYYAYVSIDPNVSLAQVKPGMTATVQVVVNHADDVVTLASTAVTARGNNATVNVETGTDPNKTTATPITIGLRGDSTLEIMTGLKAGDKVVVARAASTGTGTTTGVGGAGAVAAAAAGAGG